VNARMIAHLVECSEEEVRAQSAYSAATPVAQLSSMIHSGQLIVWRGTIAKMDDLGRLKTEFGEIGRLRPPLGKFLVSELLPTLRANRDVPDDHLLLKIESLIEPVLKGAIEMNVSILEIGAELVIMDGNKRAIAFHEGRRSSASSPIAFEVFLLRPKRWRGSMPD
jgi:hypothetical protein